MLATYFVFHRQAELPEWSVENVRLAGPDKKDASWGQGKESEKSPLIKFSDIFFFSPSCSPAVVSITRVGGKVLDGGTTE